MRIAFVLLFLSLLLLGCPGPGPDKGNKTVMNDTVKNKTTLEGIPVKQGTVLRQGELSIGAVSVSSDSATIGLWIESRGKRKDATLGVGEETEFEGYRIKNLGTWVDPALGPNTPPGGDNSYVALRVLKPGEKEPVTVRATLGENFQLKVNQSAVIEEEKLTIVFLNVSEESRCPLDVICEWEGQAIVSLRALKDGESLGEFDVGIRGSGIGYPVNVSSYSVALVGLEPRPSINSRIELSDYVATLVVSKQK